MADSSPLDRLGGTLLVATMVLFVSLEFTGAAVFSYASGLTALLGLAAFTPRVAWTRRIFVIIGLVLVVLSAALQPDWAATTLSALERAAFIGAFFTALTAIRFAAIGDPGIIDCGRFLAGQPPGRRYLALTLGGHLFGLILMYGSISLLGALATDSSAAEPNEEVRAHRRRRMLVAIQRGFISTLTWSPLAFAAAITLTIIPGAQWSAALPFTLTSALILAATGWLLDTIFKPRLSGPRPPIGPAEGQWFAHLRPLFVLLGIMVVSVGIIHFLTGVRIIGAVMALVPAIALVWIAFQPDARDGRLRHAGNKARRFAFEELPTLEGELVLLMMAGFIGTMGSHLLAPAVAASGLDLTAIPTPILLVGLFWMIPITGQLGMNPILSVSLLAPLLPTPEALGVSPAIVVCAITSGWALSGATSPFTASVLLVGAYGKVTASHVGVRWNGLYAGAAGVVISAWITVLTLLAG
ncbi:hypothetical protein LX81_00508 [Palleronia aestuarii]|uniref:H+/citrate symporter n=1 Tax=Palleronia aestuarii TaxID=568105 RepID=A0A2W7NEF9_9RHOB|nr:hypothetical protein [Palleronia aestuarii]PZX18815.1 hypothetical protein LX81_00508 [Palleronia aestuarii]